MLVGTAFELVLRRHPSRPENISPCISFCVMFYIYFVFAMFIVLLLLRGDIMGGEHSNSLHIYIFVFVDEVLIKN